MNRYELIRHVCGHEEVHRLFGSDRIIQEQRLYYRRKPCVTCDAMPPGEVIAVEDGDFCRKCEIVQYRQGQACLRCGEGVVAVRTVLREVLGEA